jgi:hypothetical protein
MRFSSSPALVLVADFLAFGQGGHYVIVRDTHTVDGTATGGSGFGYELRVDERGLVLDALAFPSTVQGALEDVGGVALYSFDANENADFTVDLQADGDLDARLFVFSVDEGDWVARNDDRAQGDPNPLLDAFFPVGGPMILVVESTAEDANDLGFTITTTGN